MADIDLLFQEAPLVQPADLVFGGEPIAADYPVTLALALPGPQVQMKVAPPVDATLAVTLPGPHVAMAVTSITAVEMAATLPGPVVHIELGIVANISMLATMPGPHVDIHALYRSETQRPTVGTTRSSWQEADTLKSTLTDQSQRTRELQAGAEVPWSPAIKLQAGFATLSHKLERSQIPVATGYTEAIHVDADMRDGWRELSRKLRPSVRTGWQTATQVAMRVQDAWQERFRDRRPTLVSPWGQARALGLSIASGFDTGRPMVVVDRSDWEEAIRPPIGVSIVPPEPPGPPCYTPPAGNEVHLVFSDEPGTSDLVFVCERGPVPPTPTIVVPIKRVYLVNNSSSLHRVDTGQQLPAFAMSLSLDVDSWTWGFSASMPYDALSLLGRQTDGSPAELAAIINGVEYRVVFEKYTTTRQFGSMPGLSINCRGKQALLDAPYAPVTNFINTEDVNANQLMLQSLMLNGVPIGWDVDFQLEDWIVPANQFALTGSYMGAVTQIAAAVGGYIQPSPIAQTLRALSRYPVAPWNWADAHIDYDLPSAVTRVEAIEYREKVVYNHVYVSGTSAGVVGSVKRAGTAGDVEKQMVTDALIGDDIAARQRGRVELSDVGKQEIVNLTLPVLPETGIILPGAMIKYRDTAASKIRVGIVRSVNADVAQSNLAEIWQTIGVETHVD